MSKMTSSTGSSPPAAGSPAGSKFTLGEDSTSTTAAAAPSSYAELRRRPINFSPETRYTVRSRAAAVAGGWGPGLQE